MEIMKVVDDSSAGQQVALGSLLDGSTFTLFKDSRGVMQKMTKCNVWDTGVHRWVERNVIAVTSGILGYLSAHTLVYPVECELHIVKREGVR